MICFRSQLLRYRTDRAFNTMRQMPNYGKALQATVHHEVQEEVEAAARSLADPTLKDFTREDLLSFNPNKLFEKQLEKAPIMMTALVAASTRQKLSDINVSDSMLSVFVVGFIITFISLEIIISVSPRSRPGLGSGGRRRASRWTSSPCSPPPPAASSTPATRPSSTT